MPRNWLIIDWNPTHCIHGVKIALFIYPCSAETRVRWGKTIEASCTCHEWYCAEGDWMICVSLSASIFVCLVKMQGDQISDDYKQLDWECKVPWDAVMSSLLGCINTNFHHCKICAEFFSRPYSSRQIRQYSCFIHARLLYIKMNLLALISRNFLVSLLFFQIRNVILNQTFANQKFLLRY